MNYHFMGASLAPSLPQHFSSIFKPISGNEEADQRTRRGLSLWMGQGSQPHEAMGTNLQEIHQLGSSVSSGSVYADPLVSCSNPPPSSLEYQLSWVFGSKQCSSNTEDQLTSSTTSLLSSNVKEGGSGGQIVSVPSLYSTQIQRHSHQTPSGGNMSATALLQKAAQMGATSADPFLGSFGLKCDGISLVQNSNHLPTNHAMEENPKDLSSFNQLQMYPPAKRRRNIQNDDSSTTGGGQTRDFLGVGVQTICHPSSINGWIDYHGKPSR